jgi:DNA (cytosine-5)-methyltransferase 3A
MPKSLKILSLFDGISCGQVALERAGIPVEVYYASEIDKYAIEITQKNYPNTIQLGDVTKIDFTEFIGKVDLLIGGSPCQDLSISKNNRQGLQGARSGLFYKYVEALETIKPKYFLLENVASMKKEDKDTITSILSVEPILINSALVSAQQRKRLYWTNIPNITQPQDKGILLRDILESGLPYLEKAEALTASYNGAVFWNSIQKHQRTMVAEPLKIPEATVKGYVEIQQGDCVDLTQLNSKTRRGRSMKEKSNCITASNPQYYQYLGKEPIRKGQYGKGGQGQRIYSVQGKSVSLSANGGGQGAKTGLYKIDLPDGEYLIRKLTPLECERLQTLPDNYTQLGQSYYYYNIYDIINLVIKGELLCKNAKLRDVKTQSRIEKQDCAINIICDISDMEQQNSQETLLNEKKNVLLMDAIINNKQEWVIVLNTIKDLKEQEQQSLKKNLKNVNIVIDWQLQEGCVIGIIKIGSDTEMQNIPIKLEKEQIITDIKNLKENIESRIEKLPQKCWGEIYPLKKLYTTLIWINLIMIKKIYTCVIKTNTQAYINSLIKLQDNLLKLELSNLKMVDTFPISSSQRYKCIGNGWTVDVIAHIFNFLRKEFDNEQIQLRAEEK